MSRWEENQNAYSSYEEDAIDRTFKSSFADPDANEQSYIDEGLDVAVGLRNTGNICYFNSLIQGIFQIRDFRSVILNIYCPKDLEHSYSKIKLATVIEKRRKKLSFELVVALQKLFVHMMYGTRSVLNPQNIIKLIVDSQGEPVILGEELDFGEFLVNFLERIEEGIFVSNLLADSDKVIRGSSPMGNLFFGKSEEATVFEESSSSKMHSARQVVLGPINLSIAQKDVMSSLRVFTKYLVETNQNGELIQGTKQIKLIETPRILVILPHRVKYDRIQGPVKNFDAFEVPKKICLNPFVKKIKSDHSKEAKRFMSETQNHNYKLHSVVIHEGDINNGHYYTLVHDEENRRFAKFNDSQVTEISEERGFRLIKGGEHSEEKHHPCAYCIFYIKGEAEQIQSYQNLHKERQIEAFIPVPTYSQPQPSGYFSAQAQQICELYFTYMDQISLQAARWDEWLNSECLTVPLFPIFPAYLLSSSSGLTRLAEWSVFNILLKSQNIENHSNIIKGLLKQNLGSLELSEDDERQLRVKKQEYKKIFDIFEIVKDILKICDQGKWENVFDQLFSIEKKLDESKNYKPVRSIQLFIEYIYRVLLLKLCKDICENWGLGKFEISIVFADNLKDGLRKLNHLKLNPVFSVKISESLDQILSIKSSTRINISFIQPMNNYRSEINAVFANRKFASSEGMEHTHYIENYHRQIMEYFNENDPIFSQIQDQNERLESVFYQWQINFEEILNLEKDVRTKGNSLGQLSSDTYKRSKPKPHIKYENQGLEAVCCTIF